jgi:hypothetical protein
MRQYKTRGIVINGPQDYEKIQEIIPNLFQYDQATPIRNGHFPYFRFPIQLDSNLEGRTFLISHFPLLIPIVARSLYMHSLSSCARFPHSLVRFD